MLESKKSKLPNNKSFGLFFAAIFLILSFFFINFRALFLLLSFIIFVITLLKPTLLDRPNLYWYKFGFFLSKIFSPIFLTLIYLIIFVPFGLISRILSKDIKSIVNKKYDKKNKSYWTNCEEKNINFNDQF